jgi:transcriptional regulator with XRE-family HTH domain
MPGRDFLDEVIAEETAKNPDFPRLVAEATERREMARMLTKLRESQQLSQTQVAAKMNTSASVISKFEHGGDVKISTVQRYLTAVGFNVSLLRAALAPGATLKRRAQKPRGRSPRDSSLPPTF